MQIYSVVDWSVFRKPHCMHLSDFFAAALCNDVSLGEIKLMFSFHHVHQKAGNFLLGALWHIHAQEFCFLAYFPVSPIYDQLLQMSWCTTVHYSDSSRGHPSPLIDSVVLRAVCEPPLYHMGREPLQLPRNLGWYRDWPSFSFLAVSWRLRLLLWGVLLGISSYNIGGVEDAGKLWFFLDSNKLVLELIGLNYDRRQPLLVEWLLLMARMWYVLTVFQ